MLPNEAVSAVQGNHLRDSKGLVSPGHQLGERRRVARVADRHRHGGVLGGRAHDPAEHSLSLARDDRLGPAPLHRRAAVRIPQPPGAGVGGGFETLLRFAPPLLNHRRGRDLHLAEASRRCAPLSAARRTWATRASVWSTASRSAVRYRCA